MQNLFEEIKVPQTELENIVNEKLDMIRKDSRKKKRTKILCGFTAAAACMAGLIVFSVSNPVLAAQLPLIGHLFRQVEDQQSYYRDIDETQVQKMPEAEDDENVVDGIKISLSEIYCNTEALYMTVVIESEEAFPDYLLNNTLVQTSQTPDLFMLDTAETFHWNMDVQKIYTWYGSSASDSWETYTLDGPWSFEADVTAKQTEKIDFGG